MPHPILTVKPKETSRLSKVSAAISIAAGCLLIALLTSIGVTANFVARQDRTNSGIAMVEDYVCREIENAGAPIGVVKEYTFPVSEAIGGDTYLAFYTVHQYVDVRETDVIHWMGKKYRILSIELDRTQMKKVITTEEIDE